VPAVNTEHSSPEAQGLGPSVVMLTESFGLPVGSLGGNSLEPFK
jgi:hypothetical protein